MRATLVTRRSLWFATAYTMIIIVHEGAHALAAHALGLEATLFNFWVNADPARQATIAQRAAFGAAGPLASLVAGVLAGFAYRRVERSAAAVPLLYLAVHGIANFAGNLISAAFVGDFSNLATLMGLPTGVRHGASAIGAVSMLSVLYIAGRALMRWTPARANRAVSALKGVLLPAAIGTALIVLVNQPTPLPGFAAARIGEGSLWIVAAAGAIMAPAASRPLDDDVGVRRADIAIAIFVAALVRIMVLGIRLGP